MEDETERLRKRNWRLFGSLALSGAALAGLAIAWVSRSYETRTVDLALPRSEIILLTFAGFVAWALLAWFMRAVVFRVPLDITRISKPWVMIVGFWRFTWFFAATMLLLSFGASFLVWPQVRPAIFSAFILLAILHLLVRAMTVGVLNSLLLYEAWRRARPA